MGSRTFFMQFLKGAFELSADDMYLCTCKCDYLGIFSKCPPKIKWHMK